MTEMTPRFSTTKSRFDPSRAHWMSTGFKKVRLGNASSSTICDAAGATHESAIQTAVRIVFKSVSLRLKERKVGFFVFRLMQSNRRHERAQTKIDGASPLTVTRTRVTPYRGTSRTRYCTASATWCDPITGTPSRSAIVRATRTM